MFHTIPYPGRDAINRVRGNPGAKHGSQANPDADAMNRVPTEAATIGCTLVQPYGLALSIFFALAASALSWSVSFSSDE